jgi:hypothetical protein
MGALYQGRLADWPAVVTSDWLRTERQDNGNSVQLSVGDSQGKFVAEEELEVGLWIWRLYVRRSIVILEVYGLVRFYSSCVMDSLPRNGEWRPVEIDW